MINVAFPTTIINKGNMKNAIFSILRKTVDADK